LVLGTGWMQQMQSAAGTAPRMMQLSAPTLTWPLSTAVGAT
jgi:hypothetical protein